MALNLDVSKLTQSAAVKPTAHDNCIVLDLGTGTFPRDIEVRLPDDDGARQNALWDGSLNLAVNDVVLCFEYSGISAWRIMAMGGNDGGAGQVRVSEVWESDFGAVALQADASGNVTVNGTRTLTIPTDLIHAGDADTKWSFTDDDVEITVGGLSMLKLTEAAQDLITLGPGSGDVDIDFNGDLFLQGSDGRLGIATTGPDAKLDILDTAGAQLRLTFEDGVKFADLTVDTNHHLTIDPSSTGQIKLDATVTVIDEIQHEGDTDTKLGFTDDVQTFTVGGEVLLTLTEAGQDVVKIGDGGDVDINFNDDMFLQGSTGTFGIGTVSIPAGVKLIVQATGDHTRALFGDIAADKFAQFGYQNSGGTWTFANVNAAGGNSFNIIRGASTNVAIFSTAGDMGIGIAPTAQLHVDQPSTTAAQPVLLLDQADISEEMIEFATTIGTGNAIEAVGAKTLTVTHFIKVTLPGSLTRYIEVGTIA